MSPEADALRRYSLMGCQLNRAAAITQLQALQAEAEDKHGGPAVIYCLSLCARHDLQLPAWLRRAFLQRFYAVTDARAQSWDDVFGRPHPQGISVHRLRHRRQLVGLVHEAVLRLVSSDPARHRISEDTFALVGALPRIGLSASAVARCYRTALREGRVNVAHLYPKPKKARQSGGRT